MQVAANDHKLARAFRLKLMCDLRGHAHVNFVMHTFTILYINWGHRKIVVWNAVFYMKCSLYMKYTVLHGKVWILTTGQSTQSLLQTAHVL